MSSFTSAVKTLNLYKYGSLLAFIGLSALFIAGCADEGDTNITNINQYTPKNIRVMTRNLYLGADLGPIMAETNPNNIPMLAATAFVMISSNNFSERAGALADEIADTMPHLVGLQEVTLLRTQSPSDTVGAGAVPSPVPATDVRYDYLTILQDALTDRGLTYEVAAKIQNFDVEVPMLTGAGPTFDDVRLTDFDIILARSDVAYSNVTAQNFATFMPISTTAMKIDIPRGYAALDATVGTETYRFVNTHLEAFHPTVRQAQAAELIGALNAETLPVVLVGDLNSDALTGGVAYGNFTSAGYVDVWTMDYGSGTGETCCFDEYLGDSSATLTTRYDYIMLRHGEETDAVKKFAVLLGDEDGDRTLTNDLRPSDHAGLVAEIELW